MTPRSTAEIMRELAAIFVARSPADDVTEGSVLATLLGVFAEGLQEGEIKMSRVRDAFFFEGASGADLDARASDLPPGFTPRMPEAPASGTLRLTRTNTAGALVVPAGSTFGRGDGSAAQYATTEDVTFGVGVATVSALAACVTPGPDGNAPAGVINAVASAPGDVVAVTNTVAFGGGLDRESDEALISRALLWVQGLARCQPAALEAAARNFVDSAGRRAVYARVYEDPAQPGYSELVVDDGLAFSGQVSAGANTGGTVPTSGQRLFYHEAPAVSPVSLVINGSPLLASQFVSIPERGVVYVTDASAVSPGDTWAITGYNIHDGFISELQADVEDNRRAAGTRVRVQPPTIQWVDLELLVVPALGSALSSLEPTVEAAVEAYINALSPGEPAYMAAVVQAVMDTENVLNVSIYVPGVEPATLAEDVYPTTARHVLRTDAGRLDIVSSVES